MDLRSRCLAHQQRSIAVEGVTASSDPINLQRLNRKLLLDRKTATSQEHERRPSEFIGEPFIITGGGGAAHPVSRTNMGDTPYSLTSGLSFLRGCFERLCRDSRACYLAPLRMHYSTRRRPLACPTQYDSKRL